MVLNEWLNHKLPEITKNLEDINKKHFLNEQTIGLAGKEKVYQVLRLLRSALFPGVYEKYPIDESNINILIGNNIRTAALELRGLIEKCLMNECGEKEKFYEWDVIDNTFKPTFTPSEQFLYTITSDEKFVTICCKIKIPNVANAKSRKLQVEIP
jgi:hypothetical protein